jgi:predicted permease
MSLQNDVSYALRAMRRAPGFTIATIATIALGVGANAAVFSLLDALLLRPLDAARPAELVRIYTSEGRALRDERDRLGGSSFADYVDLRESTVLAGLTVYMPLGATITVNGASSRIEARVVSDEYFDVIGRPLFLGRWPGDAENPGGRAVVVSHGFWSTTLGADPSAIGRTLRLNELHSVVVAGVTASNYRGIELADVDLYLSFGNAREILARPNLLTDRGSRSARLIGRLAPGTTPRTAEQALDAVMQQLGATHPTTNANRRIAVRAASSTVPLELMGVTVIPTAGLVFAATLIMLAIAGANAAGLLLARTIRRRREIAVRLTLGATRGRIVRQLGTENVVIALVAGIVVATLLLLLPRGLAALDLPIAARPVVDGRMLGYAIGAALFVGVFFGIIPALAGTRAAVVHALRDGGVGSQPSRARAQSVLVGGQIALSTLLLVVSAALLGSLDRQTRVDPGFVLAGLVLAEFEDPLGARDRAREAAFSALAVERLAAIPGVTSVAVASQVPLTSDGARSSIYIPGYQPGPAETMEIHSTTTGPSYFRALGVPLLLGRERGPEDRDELPVVVINRAMERRYWRERDPIGTLVRLGSASGPAAEVIGVAADVHFRSLAEPPLPMFFVQRHDAEAWNVLVRTTSDPAVTLLAIRDAMGSNDVAFTLSRLRTMEDVLRSSLTVSRAVGGTLLAIGALAIVLASIGLFGVVLYVTAGRTREFGVRLALGATRTQIARLVIGFGMRRAAVGGAIGLSLGMGALRLMESMLFGTSELLPISVAVVMQLATVTLVASAIPARRAMAVPPASALQAD